MNFPNHWSLLIRIQNFENDFIMPFLKPFRMSLEKFKCEWLQWLCPQRMTWRLVGRGRWRLIFHHVSFVPLSLNDVYLLKWSDVAHSCPTLCIYIASYFKTNDTLPYFFQCSCWTQYNSSFWIKEITTNIICCLVPK